MRVYAKLFSAAVLVAITSWGCGDSSGPVLQLAQNGGFETGDFTGWTVDNAGAGGFGIVSDPRDLRLADTILAPPESLYAAVTIQNGPGSHVLYQDIYLPAQGRIRFQATVFVISHVNFVDAGDLAHTAAGNQQFRVDVMEPAAPLRDVGAGVLLAIYQTAPGDTVESAYIHLNADLTPFAGRTVRIRFAEVDNLEHFLAAVDAVSVTAR